MDSLLVIADILAVSGRNNRRDRITGGLVYDAGVFFQVIEGSADDLERLMDRMRLDSRHADITVISREAGVSRMFADWSMAAPRLSPEHEAMMRATITASQVDPVAAINLLHRLAIEDSVHSTI